MYREFYGLTSSPFENTPDPGFLFLSKQHREVLSSLLYGIDSGKGFILVAGDVGTGKTTLVRALLQKLNPSSLVINIINPKTSFDDIFNHLALEIGLKIEGKNKLDCIKELGFILAQMHSNKQRIVILIDEAHMLSEQSLEDIRLLSNIETDKVKLIQIVLIGQNEIYTLLNQDRQKSLKQRIVINRCLDPLNRQDTSQYVKHRLKIAGRNKQLFSRQALRLVWKRSGGTPRLINQICDNAMLIGFAMERDTIGRGIIREVINDMQRGTKESSAFLFSWQPVGIAALAIMATIIFYWRFNMSDSLSSSRRIPVNDKVVNSVTIVPELQEDVTRSVIIPHTKTVDFTVMLPRKKTAFIPAVYQEPVDLRPDIPATVQENSPLQKSEHVQLIHPGLQPVQQTISYAPTAASKTKVVRVDEWLFKLAKKEYGYASDTVIDLIHMANKDISKVSQVYVGQEIILPDITRSSLLIRGYGGKYHIHYASFYDFTDAQLARQNLVDAGYEAFIAPTIQGEQFVFRVYIGIFKDLNIAEKSLQELDFQFLPFLAGSKQ